VTYYYPEYGLRHEGEEILLEAEDLAYGKPGR
jgi:hypothetical protein